MTWIYEPPPRDRRPHYVPDPELIPPCPRCGDQDQVQRVLAGAPALSPAEDELGRVHTTDSIIEPGSPTQPWWCPSCRKAYPWAYPFERTLLVREPWASLLIDGYKIWELRRTATKVRGLIGLTVSGSEEIAGSAELVDVHGPFTAQDLRAHRNMHLVNDGFLDAYAAGKPLFAWECRHARRFERPAPYAHPQGAVIWVKLRLFGSGAGKPFEIDRSARSQPLELGWTGTPPGAKMPFGYPGRLYATPGWCNAAQDLDPPLGRIILCEDVPGHSGPHFSNQADFVPGWTSYEEWVDSDATAFRLKAEDSHPPRRPRRRTARPDQPADPPLVKSEQEEEEPREQIPNPALIGVAPGPGQAKVVVVMTAGAGSGKTMTATNLAVLLAQRNDPPRVCVVDADLVFGDVCYSLGLEPEFTVVEAVHLLDHPDGPSLESTLTHHPAGFEVLAAPLKPAFADEVSAAAMEEIINKLGEMFDYVIVDPASLCDETLMSILNLAHQVLLIVDVHHPGLSGVKNAKHVLEHMLREKFPVSKMQLVLNNRTARVGIDQQEIERSLKLKIAAIIPSDGAVPASIKEGRPVVEFAPESRAAKALKTVCDLVVV